MTGCQDRQKGDIAQAILTGYYTAYYTNGGKKVKKPNELIEKIYERKQSFEDGVRQIERIKALEKKFKKGG